MAEIPLERKSEAAKAILADLENRHMSREVVASLEGMRVVVNDEWCDLHEYDFINDCWVSKARCPWPMERGEAESWLNGWNAHDRFTAMNQLVAPLPD